MRLFAKKPCTFGGQKFKIGDEIPVELVANPNMQAKRDVIAIADGTYEPLEDVVAQVGIVKFEVPIHAEEGDLTLTVTNEELIAFTDILQTGVNKAEDKQKISDIVQNIESEDLLIMLDALDGRKHVKEEVQARVNILKAAEQSGGDE